MYRDELHTCGQTELRTSMSHYEDWTLRRVVRFTEATAADVMVKLISITRRVGQAKRAAVCCTFTPATDVNINLGISTICHDDDKQRPTYRCTRKQRLTDGKNYKNEKNTHLTQREENISMYASDRLLHFWRIYGTLYISPGSTPEQPWNKLDA